tara:strand:+ start:469 stop:1500 length:1032 start_codon:yes stop_codon:yes gene_type:complete
MLVESQIKEIRVFLEKAENPLFFFDDDPDGLTSYLLLKKHYRKGRGVCIKASPNASGVYYAAVSKHKPDLVVILDKPVIDQEIIDLINVPIVWIDHHQPLERDGVNYYNPMVGDKPDNRPTCYWAYKVVEDNEWIAVAGIIADWHVPEKEIVDKFKYKKMLGNYKEPPKFLFESDYGKIVKILSYSLKGSTENMNNCIEAWENVNDPMEIFEQTTPEGKMIYEKFEKINKGYELLLDDALSQEKEGDVFVYTYPGGKHSYTGGLSNELVYKLANDVIIVGREKDGDVRMSLRSKKKPISPVLKKALEEVEGYGGGHANACGASVKMDDFPKFVKLIKEEYDKS